MSNEHCSSGFQILVILASLIGTTSGFIFNTKCIAAPCICILNHIHCGGRQLSQVPVFSRLNERVSFLEVYLGSNKLTTIPANAFKNLSTVNETSIFLQNNHISKIDIRAFNGVENSLSHIGLENNNLTHVPVAFTELSSLHYLNLLRNPLLILDA